MFENHRMEFSVLSTASRGRKRVTTIWHKASFRRPTWREIGKPGVPQEFIVDGYAYI
jgi:hypothetical protein